MKHFSLQRRFTKKMCKRSSKRIYDESFLFPYKFCKQKGGTRKSHNKAKEDFKYNPFYLNQNLRWEIM